MENKETPEYLTNEQFQLLLAEMHVATLFNSAQNELQIKLIFDLIDRIAPEEYDDIMKKYNEDFIKLSDEKKASSVFSQIQSDVALKRLMKKFPNIYRRGDDPK